MTTRDLPGPTTSEEGPWTSGSAGWRATQGRRGTEVVAPWFAPAAAIRDALLGVYGPDPRPSESDAFMGLVA